MQFQAEAKESKTDLQVKSLGGVIIQLNAEA